MLRLLMPIPLLALWSMTALAADLRVSEAWVRGTVPGQKVTAAYMTIEVASPIEIVGASSPRAASVQLHEFDRDAGPSRMRTVDRIPISAGKPVKLSPGGYHLMITGLDAPLKDEEELPITLVTQRGNTRSRVTITAKVRPLYVGIQSEAKQSDTKQSDTKR